MSGTGCNVTKKVHKGVCSHENGSGKCVNECDVADSSDLNPETACAHFDAICPKTGNKNPNSGKQMCKSCDNMIANTNSTDCKEVECGADAKFGSGEDGECNECDDDKYNDKLCIVGSKKGVCEITTKNVTVVQKCVPVTCGGVYGAAESNGECDEGCKANMNGTQCAHGETSGVCDGLKCASVCTVDNVDNICSDDKAICAKASNGIYRICKKCGDGNVPDVKKFNCIHRTLSAVELMCIVFPLAFVIGIALGFAIVYFRKHNKDSKDDQASA